LNGPAGGAGGEQLQVVKAEGLIRLQIEHKAGNGIRKLANLQRGDTARKGLGLGLLSKAGVGKIQHHSGGVLQNKQERPHLSLCIDFQPPLLRVVVPAVDAR
jgi:hypothetical protein